MIMNEIITVLGQLFEAIGDIIVILFYILTGMVLTYTFTRLVTTAFFKSKEEYEMRRHYINQSKP